MPSKYTGSKEEVQALSAYINLARATNSFAQRIHRHLNDSGVTGSQFAVMEALLHCGPQLQKDLCNKLLTSSGNVTFVIDGLEQRGWVRRVRQSDDRRCVKVELTDEGRNLIEDIFPRHAKIVAEEMGVLSLDEQEQLRSLCRKVGKGRCPGSDLDCPE
jgi:MarR family transcriptional regulator, 2-MHQ and catechol-resistance regulon repressor